MSDLPTYSGASVFFTALGVFLVWASWGGGRLSVNYLNARLSDLGLPANWLMAVEFLVTMVVGVLIAIALVNPQTPQQAIAAGMGWTSLVVRPTPAPVGSRA